LKVPRDKGNRDLPTYVPYVPWSLGKVPRVVRTCLGR
jgi:hypothetical protein